MIHKKGCFKAFQTMILCSALVASADNPPSELNIALPIPHSMAITGLERLESHGLIVSGSEDGQVKIWEESSGLLISEFSPHEGAPVAGIAAHPTIPGRIAVSSVNPDRDSKSTLGGDAIIDVIDIGSNSLVLSVQGMAGRMKFSPEGRWLIVFAHSLLDVWDTTSGLLHVSLTIDAETADFVEETTLAFRRQERVVFLDLTTGVSSSIATGHHGALSISPDGRYLASLGDEELGLWRLPDGTMITRSPLISDPRFVFFAADGSVIAGDYKYSMWEGSAMNIIYRLKPETWELETYTAGNSPLSMVTDGGNAILLGQSNGRIQRLDPNEQSLKPPLGIEASDITAVAFSSDARYLAGGYRGGGAVIWEPTSNWYRILDPNKQIPMPPTPIFSEDADRKRISSTFVAGEGVTNASAIEGREVVGLLFLGSESLVIVNKSGRVDIIDVINSKLLKTFSVSSPRAVIGGSPNRAIILDRLGATIVDAVSFETRHVEIRNASPLWSALSTAGDRLILANHSTSLEVDTSNGIITRSGPRVMGTPVFLKDGSISHFSWETPPGKQVSERYSLDDPIAVDWSSDFQLGTLARESGSVRVWAKGERGFSSTDFHIRGNLADIALSPSGQIIAVASGHGRIALHRTHDGLALGDLVSFDRRGWLVRSATGLFDGSYMAWDKVRGTLQGSPIEAIEAFSIFDSRFRPQLLAELMKGNLELPTMNYKQFVKRGPPRVKITGPLSNYVREATSPTTKAIQRNGETRLDENGEVLSFDVVAPNPGLGNVTGFQVVRESTVNLTAEVQDAGDGVGECRIFRNRRLQRSISPTLDLEGVTEISVELPVRDGDNLFSLYCFSHSGLRSSEEEVHIYGGESLKVPATAFVFVIGINKYQPDSKKLSYAVQDADLAKIRLVESLETIGLYESVRVASLTDKEATAAQILKGLKILAGSEPPVAAGPLASLRRSDTSDVVFIYFAGHGAGFSDDYHLVAYDGSVDEEAIKGTVSTTAIRDVLEPLQADRTVIIIDACESGQALDQLDPRAGPIAGRTLAQLAYDKAIFVISAAQSQQAARELQRLGHGLFSYVLFERGLGVEADINHDGSITITEWLNFAQAETPKEQDAGLMALSKKILNAKDYQGRRSYFSDQVLFRAQTPRVFIPDPILAKEFVITHTEAHDP